MDTHLQRDLAGADARPAHVAADTALRTSEVIVIFTTTEATLAALRVAVSLSRACNASVRLIAQQSPTHAAPADSAPSRSPVESSDFRRRLAQEIDARVDVLVCVYRRVADLARTLLGRHSLVVIGGRASWWPTRQERLRRALESQGHYVLFVNEIDHAA
jgi:hypothetical protein